MSKKRRTRQQTSTAPSAPVRASVSAVRPVRAPAETRVKEVDFTKEYHYVVEDLKRIAIYAAGLFALLIVLAIIFAFVA